MNYKFSKAFAAMKPTALRESFKLAAEPGIISFAAGSPAPETFPVAEMREVLQAILNDPVRAREALQYGVTEGVAALREVIMNRMRARFGVGSGDDAIMITSGSQQANELCAKVFLNEGDAVFVENPTFSNSLNALRSFSPKLVGIPMQPDGMDVEHLEKALQNEPRRRLIYCISTFQNPTGYTTCAGKRKAIYELACKYDVMILEDDPYLELRYSGEVVPPIKRLDLEGRVVYTNSMTKVIAPGIRVGYCIAGREVIAKMTIAKQGEDVHANVPLQHFVLEYMTSYDYQAHLRAINELYAHKRDIMLACMDALLPKGVEYSRPDGGLFVWCRLPDGLSAGALVEEAYRSKLLISDGNGFDVNATGNSPCFRMSFSLPSQEDIVCGIERLNGCIRRMMEERR